MDNSMQNMLDMYLYETNTLVEQLDALLLDAEKVGSFSHDDVNEIFRIMHTIKGSSAMMQFNSLATLTHEVENLFFFIRENTPECEFGHDLFDLLFQASDFIKSQVAQIENDQPLDEDIDDLVAAIKNFLSVIKQENTDQLAEDAAQAATDAKAKDTQKTESALVASASGTPAKGGAELDFPSDFSGDSAFVLKVFFDEECGMENLRSFMLVNSLQDVCTDFSYLPADVETDNTTSAYIIDHGFAIYLQSQEDLETATTVVKSSMNIKTYEAMQVKRPIISAMDEINALAEAALATEKMAEQNAATSAAEKKAADSVVGEKHKKTGDVAQIPVSSGKQSLISVNLAKLDLLMDIVGEIVITESMVTSSPDLQGFKLDNFTKSARQLRKLTDDLQDTAMSIRMVPVSSVFQKMNRIVRDMSQSLNKNARLVTIGADTEVDKTIVDNIGDPIMHMVRNSMDHGLEESEEERIAAGKDPQGTIILEAQHTGSEVIISIRDDGRGVDLGRVLTKAKDKGLLIKPENEYTQREILQLLLLPGFSTNEIVTEFSGRGVGMDVVKKNIEKVGGVVTMASEQGRGTSTTFKIPLTLAIVDGMEISVGESIFTIPIHNIRQSFKVSEEDLIHDTGGGEMIQKMDRFYPVIRLNRFFDVSTKTTDVGDGIMIWVEADEKSYCLFVDELLGEQQVVVKPLPSYLSTYNVKDSGIAGCTILGDGNISIILDITNLYNAAIGDIL